MGTNKFHLQHEFDGFSIDASFAVNDGEIVALFGDSGSGKSSILKLIAGLIGDGCLAKSELAFLFQDCTLFENFNVYQNLVYSNTRTLCDDLRILFGFEKVDVGFYDELLELSGLSHLRTANVSELSGGQKQRLALICALSRKAKFILLDEPFSALDDANTLSLIKFIKTLRKKYNCTIIFVSHSCFEINALANRVYYVENGKITKSQNHDEFFAEMVKNNEFLSVDCSG